jgi:hypothetical protein
MLMKKAKIKRYNYEEEVMVLNIQIVPRITMQRNDLEYSLHQENEEYVIYMESDGDIRTERLDYLELKFID